MLRKRLMQWLALAFLVAAASSMPQQLSAQDCCDFCWVECDDWEAFCRDMGGIPVTLCSCDFIRCHCSLPDCWLPE